MSVFNIIGNNNELNAILKSDSANLVDSKDLSGDSIIGVATISFPDLSSNQMYILDISGNNHEINAVHDSENAYFADGSEQLDNNTVTGFTII